MIAIPKLDFKGKEFVRNHHLSVPHRPLEPDVKKSVGKPGLAGNLIVHGDNLHALKSLLPMYAGKVNCIYIDPPYNTGNENWCYNDNVNSPTTRSWLNQNPVGIEDGLRHDKWGAMMWPRLVLLRELLAEDGVIFISIDDNEQHRLRMMMDEIFGENKFVTQIAWQSRASVQNDTDISVNHEYILVYAKSRRVKDRRLKKSNSATWWNAEGFAVYPLFLGDDRFSNPDSDPRGPWKADPFDAPSVRPNLTYEIENPNTHEKFMPPAGRHWRMTENRYRDLLSDNRIIFGRKGKTRPQLKVFYDEVQKFGQVETTWFDASKVGTTTEGTQELEVIFNEKYVIQYPKPSRLITHLLRMSTQANDIVLDSFAGSGTTAQAVLALNKEDGGNRKFILVECEDYADKTTARRVRRIIKGVPKSKDENLKEGLGGEFTFCTLGEAIAMDDLLSGKHLPSFEELGKLLFHTATNEVIDPAVCDPETGYLGTSEKYHVWLIYQPDLNFLKSDASALTLDRAREVAKAKQGQKRHLVFASARFVSSKTLANANDGKGIPVDYQPLPGPLYRIAGK